MQKNSCILLTGATGLLGRYLLRDLSLQGVRVAVLVRDGATAGAEGRVDGLMRDWREVAGVDVPRPVVLPGDIRSPGLGLSPADLEWIEANVGEVVHAAASLAFGRRESDDEPYASNVGGTANVLELCRSAGIISDERWSKFSREKEMLLLKKIHETKLQVVGKSMNKEEFVTCGGIPLEEVDMKTMESRKVPGLYFAGETLDIDGITGGFNFQAAWTTAWIAGQSIAGDG